MAEYTAVSCPTGWGFDTVQAFTPALAARLRAAPYPGQPLLALWRYVSLQGPPFAHGDITPGERDAILGAGWLLGLVQRVERPGWAADPGLGAAHGRAAAMHAASIGYPHGCHVALDLEGLGNAGAPVVGYVVGWCDAVHEAGYSTMLYVGYDDGLAAWQVSTLAQGGHVDAYWSDAGPRSLPDPLRFAVKQHIQTQVAGIYVDPDEIRVPGLVLMGDTPADLAHADTLPPTPIEDARPAAATDEPHE